MADFSHLEKMGNELKCPICLSLFDSAFSIPCNHVFCNSCIQKSMKCSSSCPVCKIPFRRRELHAAPYMDNLVSIFKSMEFASGAKKLDGSAQNTEANTSGANSTKGKKKLSPKKKNKDVSKPNPNSSKPILNPKTKPSFPAKKRVHVTSSPLNETPVRPEKVLKLSDLNDQSVVNKEKDQSEKVEVNLRKSPSFSPFFWLREDEDEEEENEGGENEDFVSLSDEAPTPYAPCFSDIKDSDDERNLNTTPNSKVKAAKAFNGEISKWTQKHCSQKLCFTPSKKNKGKKKLDQAQGDKISQNDETSPVINEDTKPKNKRKRNNKAGNSISNKRTVKNSEENGQNSTEKEKIENLDKPSVYKRKNRKENPEKSTNRKTVEISTSISNKRGTKKSKENGQNLTEEKIDEMNKLSVPKRKNRKENPVKSSNCKTLEISTSVSNKKGTKNSKEIGQNSIEEKVDEMNKLSIEKKFPKRKNRKEDPEKVTNSVSAQETDKNNEEKESKTREKASKMKNIIECDLSDFSLKKCEIVPSNFVCAFCHSSDVTEVSGEMVHYFEGKPVNPDFITEGNIIHSHKNCLEWAPDVYFEDDVAVNLSAELARSKRIKCCCCGIKGAALGCFDASCRKSFHFTCAKLIPECKWDDENFVMLCPLHESFKLSIENSRPEKKNKNKSTTKSNSQVLSVKKNENGSTKSWKWPVGSPSKWILSCSALSLEEKELVSEFSKLTGAQISKCWSPNITHVIASTNEKGACKRTLKYLMAILNGKWIITLDWIRICMEAMEPVDEEKFEVKIDVHGIRNGPRLGRLRIANKEPKLFNEMKFYLIGDYTKDYRSFIQDLIIKAGGTILQRKPISRDQQKLLDDSSPTYIIYSIENREKERACDERVLLQAEVLADVSGGKIASSAWIIDSIAACKLQPLI
ncbi:hypothetical protein LUZ60_001520 [Juncus effusus]|nr:hypothetical protein LUZ60_001520 [Juncus effusus]